MEKIDELTRKLECLKQQLHQCKLAKAELTDTEETKANSKKTEILNIKIKEVKNKIQLAQSINREFDLMHL